MVGVADAFVNMDVWIAAPVSPSGVAQEDIKNAEIKVTRIIEWIVLFMKFSVFVISRIINLKIHSVIPDSH